MNSEDVMKILEKTLASKFDMDGEGQWDSINQIEILQAFDDEFGEEAVAKIPQQELATMTTPRKIIDLLKKHNVIE